MALGPSPTAEMKSLPISVQTWFRQMRDAIQGEGGLIPWDSISKTGSDLGDLASRDHADLTNVQGGASADYYHMTQVEHTSVTGLTLVVDGTTNLTTTSNGYQLADTSSGDVTFNLPSAATRKWFHFKRISLGANNCTIARNGSDTIEGATSYSLANQYDSVTMYSDGTSTWYVQATTT